MLVPLHDGSTAVLRRIAPDDAPYLRRFHRTLSDDTVRNRFLSAKPQLSRRDAQYLTDLDFVDHVGVVACDPQRPEVILGVARWVRYPEAPDRAEAAFVVADRMQGTGIGSALAIALADLAVERDVAELTGSMLSCNVDSEGLFRRMGGELRVQRQGITNEVTTTLPPQDGRLLRLAASRRMRPGRRTEIGGRRPAVRHARQAA